MEHQFALLCLYALLTSCKFCVSEMWIAKRGVTLCTFNDNELRLLYSPRVDCDCTCSASIAARCWRCKAEHGVIVAETRDSDTTLCLVSWTWYWVLGLEWTSVKQANLLVLLLTMSVMLVYAVHCQGCINTQFVCGDGKCLNRNDSTNGVCNSSRDCSDGSDERRCGNGTWHT